MVRKFKQELNWQKKIKNRQKDKEKQQKEQKNKQQQHFIEDKHQQQVQHQPINVGTDHIDKQPDNLNKLSSDEQFVENNKEDSLEDCFQRRSNSEQSLNDSIQQQQQNLQLKKYKQIAQKIGNLQIYNRQDQQKTITNFIKSQTQFILYICGVTGSGKTTTVTKILNSMNQNYKIINCISEFCRQKKTLKQISNLITKQSLSILILDQCDQLTDLNLTISTARQSNQTLKLILICNRGCKTQIKDIPQMVTLFFMPYTQQQLYAILKLKLQGLFGEIPSLIVAEAVQKASRASGDFREIVKHLQKWVSTKMSIKNEEEEQKQYNPEIVFGNTFTLVLTEFISAMNLSEVSLMRIISQKEQQEFQRKKCRCKRENSTESVCAKMKNTMKNQEVMYNLATLRDMNIIKLQQVQCLIHQRQVSLIILKTNPELLTNLLKNRGSLL